MTKGRIVLCGGFLCCLLEPGCSDESYLLPAEAPDSGPAPVEIMLSVAAPADATSMLGTLPESRPGWQTCVASQVFEQDSEPGIIVPLRVHLTRSELRGDPLCRILNEINEIWWTQASVCFAMSVAVDDVAATAGLDLWFEHSSPFPNGVNANGVYAGPHTIYSLDSPNLAAVERPSRMAAARTAAHELGHALGLHHQNCGVACDGLLMRSGTRGFELATGTPADRDEVERARRVAIAPELGPLASPVEMPAACGELSIPL